MYSCPRFINLGYPYSRSSGRLVLPSLASAALTAYSNDGYNMSPRSMLRMTAPIWTQHRLRMVVLRLLLSSSLVPSWWGTVNLLLECRANEQTSQERGGAAFRHRDTRA